MQKQLSMKEKILLCVVAVAVICAVFIMLILKPQRAEMASVQSKLTEKQKEVSQYANFDKTIDDTSKEVGEYKIKVQNTIKEWHDTDIQNDIINDLEDKIKKSSLYDTNITFTNLQQMSITQKNGKTVDETPSLAESMAMAYLCIMQEERANAKKETAEKTENAAVTAAPKSTSDPKSTSEPKATAAAKSKNGKEAQSGIILNPEQPKATKAPDVDPKVIESFENFKKSLAGCSDAEIRGEVEKIMAKSKTNIEKLDVSISFQDSTYESIYEFLNRIEEESPKIYITSISYNDSTEGYVAKLNDLLNQEKALAEEEAKNPDAVNQPGFFENQFPSASVSIAQINQGATVTYTGAPRYTGTITISYFSLVKMPVDEMEKTLDKVSEKNGKANEKSERDKESTKL